MQEEEEGVGRSEWQKDEEPRRRIEDASLWIGQPRLAGSIVRIPQGKASVAKLERSEVAQRLEIVAVIAKREYLAANQRPRKQKKGKKGQERE